MLSEGLVAWCATGENINASEENDASGEMVGEGTRLEDFGRVGALDGLIAFISVVIMSSFALNVASTVSTRVSRSFKFEVFLKILERV